MSLCSRLTRRPTRRLLAGLLAGIEFLGLWAPVLAAETTPPTGDSQSEYIADVQRRVTLRNDLERRWQESRYRREQIEKTIEQIQTSEPPGDADLSQWYQERSAKIRWLDDYMRKNEDTLSRYQENLGSVYSKLDEDRRYVEKAGDEQLNQALGALVGIAGVAGIPIANRPVFGSLKGAAPGVAPPASQVKVVSRGTLKGGGKVPTSVPKASATPTVKAPTTPVPTTAPKAPTQTATPVKGAAPTGQAPTNQTAAAPKASAAPKAGVAADGWTTDVSKKGTVVLKKGDRVIDTRDSATLKEGTGKKAEVVRNEAAWQRAEGLKQMYTAKDQIANSTRDLKSQLKQAPNKEAKASINKQIKELQTQDKALAKDIKAAEKSEGGTKGATVKGVMVSAAKWALFSTALTVSMQVFTQLKDNDWDLKSINWKDAVAPLKTPEFWGGTAGSFGVSMLASAIMPGGVYLKTLAAIGGAAFGWQLGSGNLKETDWGELGAGTLGATIGTILGGALGPVGAFLGGMAGHFLATWALGKLREWLDDGSTSHSSEDREIVDLDGDLTPYAGGPPGVGGPTPPVSLGAGEIRLRMDQIYQQIDSLMTSPETSQQERLQVKELHAEYDSLFQQLEILRGRGEGATEVEGVGSWSE